MALVLVTVTGDYTDGSDTPVTGTVTFTPSSAWLAVAESQIIMPRPISVTLVNGRFPAGVQLYATDTADLNPTAGTYQVVENIDGMPLRSYSVMVTSVVNPVDMSQLSAIPGSEGVVTAFGPPGPSGVSISISDNGDGTLTLTLTMAPDC